MAISSKLIKRLLLCSLTLALILGTTLSVISYSAETKNGFNLSNALIPAREILSGGPPRDGIPAIDEPKFISGTEARYLNNSDRVLGVFRNGVAKAYPIPILNWHEVVNDRVGGEPIAITFCPLCGTGMAFEATVDGEVRSFGVSGLLYNSDVLLYDRETESLWSQIARKAVSGPLKGTRLEMVAVAHTTWDDWYRRYPRTLVLSSETGYTRDYLRNPYAGYERSDAVFFPVSGRDPRYHPKEQIIGLEINGRFKAYPFVELGKVGKPIDDKLAGESFTVHYDAEHRTGRVVDANGNEIPTVIAFWFAWWAFHPNTEIYTAS